jgi:hypothetical protein
MRLRYTFQILTLQMRDATLHACILQKPSTHDFIHLDNGKTDMICSEPSNKQLNRLPCPQARSCTSNLKFPWTGPFCPSPSLITRPPCSSPCAHMVCVLCHWEIVIVLWAVLLPMDSATLHIRAINHVTSFLPCLVMKIMER